MVTNRKWSQKLHKEISLLKPNVQSVMLLPNNSFITIPFIQARIQNTAFWSSNRVIVGSVLQKKMTSFQYAADDEAQCSPSVSPLSVKIYKYVGGTISKA